jgi:DNA-directed RNA polymerase I subunit RPA2
VNLANPDKTIIKKYRKSEPAFVEQIKALQSNHISDGFVRVCITLRMVRHPIIGDKFASRHGQKGVCSLRFAYEDMPFCESGIVPDIIFNPHGYPSRMTIGMMLESMAGKSVSMNGKPEDASPFSSAFDESRPAHEYHGNLLRQAGFDYYGTETMYSGINGEMMKAEIFIGVVYYQRLRHMVSDKYQVS